MKKSNLPLWEIMALALGEIAASAVVALIYVLLDKFSYKVITGAVLGTAVILLNFLFLSISINRAVDKVMAERGEEEMDDEVAAEFAAKHAAAIQNAAKLSVIVRTTSMLVTLVVAFILNWFDVIATLVPLLLFKPILIVSQYIKGRSGK